MFHCCGHTRKEDFTELTFIHLSIESLLIPLCRDVRHHLHVFVCFLNSTFIQLFVKFPNYLNSRNLCLGLDQFLIVQRSVELFLFSLNSWGEILMAVVRIKYLSLTRASWSWTSGMSSSAADPSWRSTTRSSWTWHRTWDRVIHKIIQAASINHA